MWIPKDSDELERLINERALEETATLDFKAALPSSSKELAKDVAAMANDGGTLVYGVGEDSSGHPSVLQPFKLAGAAERVSSIIHSALAEPPSVEIKALGSKQDLEVGYLAVVIPASPRAPHMVVIKGDNRFYGRVAKGNMPLNEGDVARLYQRRQKWERDREAHLAQVVSEMALEPHANYGFLYMFSRPVASAPNRLAALGDRDAQRSALSQMIMEVTNQYPYQFSPDFGSNHFRPIASGWRVVMGGDPDTQGPGSTLDLEVHFDCEVRLVLGRAAERVKDRLVLFDKGLAKIAVKFLALAGRLYERSGYFGAVDLGLAAIGIHDSVAYSAIYGRFGYMTSFDQQAFRETAQVMSTQLVAETSSVAQLLLSRLFHASGAVGNFDPFRPSG
jgi:hypothetical protein